MATEQALDIAWILIAAALVIFMQAGFSSLESGMVRSKNSINVAGKNFAGFCPTTGVFWVFGFAVMFVASVGGLIRDWVPRRGELVTSSDDHRGPITE